MKIDYYAYRSGMKNWNAGIKILLSVVTLCLIIGLNRIPVSLFVIFSMGALTLLAGRIPGKVYFHYMTVPLVFMIVSGAAIALEFAGSPAGDWNISMHFFYLCVTKEGIRTAAEVFFKAMAGMSSLYMLAFSTPVHEIILILQKLHLPRLLAELMNLIYRYIFILFDVAHQLQTAAKARLGYQTFAMSCKTFAGIAGNLFLISLRKAGTYYDAMLARGYDGRVEFLTEEHPVRAWQPLCCICYFLLLVGIRFAG